MAERSEASEKKIEIFWREASLRAFSFAQQFLSEVQKDNLLITLPAGVNLIGFLIKNLKTCSRIFIFGKL